MEPITQDNARITICKHLFCCNCIETVILTQQKCPMCRTALSSAKSALVTPAQEGTDLDGDSLDDLNEKSSKLEALLTILEGVSSSNLV